MNHQIPSPPGNGNNEHAQRLVLTLETCKSDNKELLYQIPPAQTMLHPLGRTSTIEHAERRNLPWEPRLLPLLHLELPLFVEVEGLPVFSHRRPDESDCDARLDIPPIQLTLAVGLQQLFR